MFWSIRNSSFRLGASPSSLWRSQAPWLRIAWHRNSVSLTSQRRELSRLRGRPPSLTRNCQYRQYRRPQLLFWSRCQLFLAYILGGYGIRLMKIESAQDPPSCMKVAWCGIRLDPGANYDQHVHSNAGPRPRCGSRPETSGNRSRWCGSIRSTGGRQRTKP